MNAERLDFNLFQKEETIYEPGFVQVKKFATHEKNCQKRIRRYIVIS